MHFAPPSSLLRAAVGYSPASFFALSPRLIDRSRRKLCIPYNPYYTECTPVLREQVRLSRRYDTIRYEMLF